MLKVNITDLMGILIYIYMQWKSIKVFVRTTIETNNCVFVVF